MEQNPGNVLKTFNTRRIIWPVLIGLLAAAWLLFKNFDVHSFAQITWTGYTAFWILMAFAMVGVRDLAYMYRIRVLAESKLDWRSCFNIIFLWEFASALLPPVLGGGFAFAIFILNGEKVKMGKSISIVMFTSFQDGLFFALMAPLVFFIVGKTALFSGIDLDPNQVIKFVHGRELYIVFWIIYFVILFYKLLVGYALFVNARSVKWLLIKLFSLPLLRRWMANARETGNEMIIASRELQHQPVSYWLKSLLATFISWTARFVLINCIIMAFHTGQLDHFLLYARQVVMGILNIGSPTPGGSGVAEAAFVKFLGQFIPFGLSPALALLWRLISYYPYLFIGAILLPRWVKKTYLSKA